ncbi:MAG: hypothetical protein OXH60_10305 [Rhodospirillales bacterium]|nr:hypothetical protein [Rhodospirillales bacterium]
MTLDDDNAAKLRDEMARTGRSLKETVNEWDLYTLLDNPALPQSGSTRKIQPFPL